MGSAEQQSSPYGAVLAALERDLHLLPSSGFRNRALLLEALTVANIILALVCIAYLRSRADHSPHLNTPCLRRVTLPSGRLLVLDTTFFLPWTSIAVGALSLGNLATLASEDMAASTGVYSALRAFHGAASFLQGWGLSFAALQSFWLAGGVPCPSAQSANLIFLSIGSCSVLLCLAAGLSTLVAGGRVDLCYAWTKSALNAIEDSQPVASMAAIMRILPGVNALRDAVQNLRVVMLATFASLMLCVLCVFAACIYGLMSLAADEVEAPCIQLPSTPPISSDASEKSDFIGDLNIGRDGYLVDFDTARVEKARDDLLLTCLTAGLLSIFGASSLAFSIDLVYHNQLFSVGSWAAELAHSTFAFFNAVVQLAVLAALLHHLLNERTSPALPPSPGALQDSTSTHLPPSSRIVRRLRLLQLLRPFRLLRP